MQPILINVSVELGMSEDMKLFLRGLLGQQKATPVASASAPTSKKAEGPAMAEKPTAKKVETPKPSTDEAEGPAMAEKPTAKKVETPKPSTDEADEESVRAAMDRARVRIEGDDWQNANSAGRKEWHSAMNSWFKSTAALFGADKPSALPDSESRKRFIDCCDRVVIVNGSIQEPVPF